MFTKRLGPSQQETVLPCHRTYGCPDIWEMEDGDFAVIGVDITRHADKLPSSAGCAADERMVRIPRRLLVQAKAHIPDTL